ncbi:hypothetical protein [Granulicoccus sp. GXG6511]|uniref:hypothetical protein n=1 Tax=Granulicoccus sp. GXG6511 TaxID=3381351 RepID=UPI003D7DC982
MEIGTSLEPNLVRKFTQAEITEELTAGGFEIKYFARAPYGHAVAVATGPDHEPAT